MRLIVRLENSTARPGEDPVWIVLDFTPQLLQEIYDVQELMQPQRDRQLKLCGMSCRCLIFWAEILGVITEFSPAYEYFGDMDSADFIHDFEPIPEYVLLSQLGKLAPKFEEARIFVEPEDIMWSVTVADIRYNCCYSSITNFANLLAQERKS